MSKKNYYGYNIIMYNIKVESLLNKGGKNEMALQKSV
jgi:hypothetical protein